MNSIRWLYLLTATAIINNNGCKGTEDELSSCKCSDIPEAVNYLNLVLPDGMALEDKCKRYAIMSALLAPKGRSHNIAASKVIRMREEEVNSDYARMNADELVEHYMILIDSYRAASKLGPPLLEMLECLRRIKSPNAHMYLENPELVMIVDIYKKILESPDTKIDISCINLDIYHPAFIKSLRKIFQGHLQMDTAESSFYKQLQDDDELLMVTSQRHRESERLRKQRLRILRPETERRKATLRQRRRLRAQARKFTQVYSPPSTRHLEHLPIGALLTLKILDTSTHLLPPDRPREEDKHQAEHPLLPGLFVSNTSSIYQNLQQRQKERQKSGFVNPALPLASGRPDPQQPQQQGQSETERQLTDEQKAAYDPASKQDMYGARPTSVFARHQQVGQPQRLPTVHDLLSPPVTSLRDYRLSSREAAALQQPLQLESRSRPQTVPELRFYIPITMSAGDQLQTDHTMVPVGPLINPPTSIVFHEINPRVAGDPSSSDAASIYGGNDIGTSILVPALSPLFHNDTIGARTDDLYGRNNTVLPYIDRRETSELNENEVYDDYFQWQDYEQAMDKKTGG